MPSFGGLPSTALGASNAASVTSVARPLTRNVSPMPGITNKMPTREFARMLRSVSASRLPGRSGTSNVRSSRIRTKPGGSPRGLTSQVPSRSDVAMHANGASSTNRRVCGVR